MGCRRLSLQLRHHRRSATTVSRGSRRGLSRRNPRNLRWKQRSENKNTGQSHAQCVLGTGEQRRREKGQRLGNASTRKWATSVDRTVDCTARRRESRRDHTRLPRAGEPSHPGSPGLMAQKASTARSATHYVSNTLPENPTRVQ